MRTKTSTSFPIKNRRTNARVRHAASRMATIFQFLIIDFPSIPILLKPVPATHPIAIVLRTMSVSWKYALDG